MDLKDKISLIAKLLFLVATPQICALLAWSMTLGNMRGVLYFSKIFLILVSLSSVFNAIILHIYYKNKFEKQKLFFYLLYFNLCICLYYMIFFIPMLPFGIIGILFGIGFLILNPYINFFILFKLGLDFKRKLIAENLYVERNYKKIVVAIFLLLYLAINCREFTSLIGNSLYMSSNPNSKSIGLSIIRMVGPTSSKTIYIGEGIYAFKNKVSDELIYKAFGKTRTIENNWRTFSSNDDELSVVSSESNTNSSLMGNKLNLFLKSSEIDSSVNLENGICYLEWTIILNNNLKDFDEARASIRLPPDSVVSRLTLWVNNEEQEAAFAKDATVEAAYNSIVNKNKDPVLVQYSSPDTVSMKCFPISQSTPMKIRIGITAPVQYTSTDKAYIKTPYFIENNFLINPQLTHHVWVESKQPIEYKSQVATKIENAFKLKIKMNNDELLKGDPIYFSEIPKTPTSYIFPLDETNFLISRIDTEETKNIEKIIFVVDFGVTMKNEFKHFIEALDKLPSGKDFIFYCVADTNKTIIYNKSTGLLESIKSDILKLKNEIGLVGGHDFIPVLVDAIEEHGVGEKTLYIWVHGNISYALSDPAPLEKILLRSHTKPNIIEFSTIRAKNILTSKSKELANLPQGKGAYSGLKKLPDFLHNINAPTKKLIFEIKENVIKEEVLEGNKHHARLWANQQIIKMGLEKNLDLERAITLSTKYQLVTPFVGAVVLENKAQYDQFNLKQVDATTVPSIPEPEEWALIIVIIAMLLIILKFKKVAKPQHV